MLLYRLTISLFVISCFYFASEVDSQAGTMMTPSSCTDAQCQEEDNCDDCALELKTECWWDGDFCRNPGACCFEYGDLKVLTCGVQTEIQCTDENKGEYFGDDSSCAEITCGAPEPPAGPIAIVPTMGQWGMILASIILGAIGVFAIIRERNLNKFIK